MPVTRPMGLLLMAAALLATTLLANRALAGESAANEFRDCATCPLLVAIKPGAYLRGSIASEALAEQTPDRDANNERPQNRVSIGYRFAVAKFEVTRGEYAAFVAATATPTATDCLSWDRANAKWGALSGRAQLA